MGFADHVDGARRADRTVDISPHSPTQKRAWSWRCTVVVAWLKVFNVARLTPRKSSTH